jgi:hypothetical protein
MYQSCWGHAAGERRAIRKAFSAVKPSAGAIFDCGWDPPSLAQPARAAMAAAQAAVRRNLFMIYSYIVIAGPIVPA